MKLAQSKLTAQGQISVPAAVRRKLGVGPGSVLEWDEEGSKVVVRKAGKYSFEDLHRAAFGGRRPAPRTIEELKESIGDHIRAKHERR